MNIIDSLFDKNRIGPPEICVEMSGNHQGSKNDALKFMHLAFKNGADFLKLQVYTPDTITFKSNLPDFQVKADNEWSKYETLHDLYSKAYTPWEWIEEIFEEAKKIGLKTFASPFDFSAVDFLEELDCPIYKIASPEITDLNLIRKCARTGKPVILSSGLASLKDLEDAVEVLKEENVPFLILKCVSAYPTDLAEINLSTMTMLRDNFNCNVGLSDHTLGPYASYAASALGASLIEKHFKMPGDISSVDASFSMELSELPNLKHSLKSIYASIGIPTLDLSESAKNSFSGRRSLYAVEEIKKGEKFTFDNIKSIRPCYGMHPKYLNKIIGKKASLDIDAGTRMQWSLIEEP